MYASEVSAFITASFNVKQGRSMWFIKDSYEILQAKNYLKTLAPQVNVLTEVVIFFQLICLLLPDATRGIVGNRIASHFDAKCDANLVESRVLIDLLTQVTQADAVRNSTQINPKQVKRLLVLSTRESLTDWLIIKEAQARFNARQWRWIKGSRYPEQVAVFLANYVLSEPETTLSHALMAMIDGNSYLIAGVATLGETLVTLAPSALLLTFQGMPNEYGHVAEMVKLLWEKQLWTVTNETQLTTFISNVDNKHNLAGLAKSIGYLAQNHLRGHLLTQQNFTELLKPTRRVF